MVFEKVDWMEYFEDVRMVEKKVKPKEPQSVERKVVYWVNGLGD